MAITTSMTAAALVVIATLLVCQQQSVLAEQCVPRSGNNGYPNRDREAINGNVNLATLFIVLRDSLEAQKTIAVG